MDLLIEEIFRRYDILQYKNEKRMELRTEKIYEEIPALKELDEKISFLRSQQFKSTSNPDFDNHAVQSQIDSMILEKRSLLKKNGYAENHLEPIFQCALCRDTGIDENTRERCVCFKEALRKERYKELLLDKDDASFENFNVSLFPDDTNVFEGITQRQNMKTLYDASLLFAETYPATRKKNMLFFGPSGLGKTYLLKCIARRIIERGFPCLYITSYKLFDMFRKDFIGEIEAINDLYSAPFIIVDDLGTEPLMKNVTSEGFYTFINERSNNALHTLFGTNFSPAELKERYGERITSRLFSLELCDTFSFNGVDIRFIEKKK